ncbi:MAG: LysM peptidoglycan-binding domain-containing protein [Chromatiales bacterium]|nr:LysM peptidoglycan-binding domain-containing protein [Chromatiales bacterium]
MEFRNGLHSHNHPTQPEEEYYPCNARKHHSGKRPSRPGLKTACSVLALTACLAIGSAQAADQGARHHAKGQYDTVTATCGVVEGDELIVIGERFQVPVETLKAQNQLTSNEIKPRPETDHRRQGGQRRQRDRRQTQHPVHHGRRHRLDAAERLPPRPDGRRNAQHRPHRQ